MRYRDVSPYSNRAFLILQKLKIIPFPLIPMEVHLSSSFLLVKKLAPSTHTTHSRYRNLEKRNPIKSNRHFLFFIFGSSIQRGSWKKSRGLPIIWKLNVYYIFIKNCKIAFKPMVVRQALPLRMLECGKITSLSLCNCDKTTNRPCESATKLPLSLCSWCIITFKCGKIDF